MAALPAAAQAPATQAPQVTVGGVIYTQYQYTDAAVHTSTFDITHAYVNVLGRFTGGISIRVTADIIPSAVTNQVIRLKYAFAAWTPTGSSLTYKLGMMQTPFVDYEEALWDYRMQGTIAVDRNGAMTSSDIGFGIAGKWNNDQVNSKIAVIGRIDVVDPNTNVANNKNTRIVGGVSYQLSPNVRLLADFDRLSFESGATATNQALFQAQFVF